MKNEPNDPPQHEPALHEIAECAYYIWESEGRPEGKGTEHWHQAELQLYLGRVHDGVLNTAQKRRRPAKPGAAKKKTPVAAAATA